MPLADSIFQGDYWRREPTLKHLVADLGALAPHALTNRATYSPPTGRVAKVESVLLDIYRVTAAAPVGEWLAQARLFRSAAPSGTWFIGTARSITNGVGDARHDNVFNGPMLRFNDVLDLDTSDLSTGGTVNYRLGSIITEADA